MKVAVVLMMHDQPLVGGELSNFLYLLKSLTLADIQPDGLLFTNQPPTKKWQIAQEAGIIVHPRNNFLYILNQYDYIIFSAAGSRTDREEIIDFNRDPWWSKPLSELQRPFAVQIQCEDNTRIFTRRDEFFNHPNCKAIIEIEYGFIDLVADRKVPQEKRFRIGPWDYSWLHNYDQTVWYNKKRAVVCATSMLASRKRIVALTRCAKDLFDIGFQLRIGGVAYAWSSLGPMKELGLDAYWKYVGEYKDSAEVDGDAVFHYNGTSKGIRRIELTTFQAVMHGCAPILNVDFAPPWTVHRTNCFKVRLDTVDRFINQKDLIENIKEYSLGYKWREMNIAFVEQLRYNNPISEITDFVAHMEKNK